MALWPNENAFDAILAPLAIKHGVPLAVVKAVVSLESGFNPRAYRKETPRPSLPPTKDHPQGGDESRGLMQLLVRTARVLGFKGTPQELYTPAVNAELGIKLLRDNIAEAKRRGLGLDAALSAYNGGWRPRLGFGGKLPSGKYGNQAYVDTVLKRVRYFERELAARDVTRVVPSPIAGRAAGGILPALVVVGLIVVGLNVAGAIVRHA